MTPDEKRIEEITKKCDENRDFCPGCRSDVKFLLSQLTTAQKLAEDRLEALRKYSKHGFDCPVGRGYLDPCECGLGPALVDAADEKEGE